MGNAGVSSASHEHAGHDFITHMGAGWEFNSDADRWELMEVQADTKPALLNTPLRLATLNVLFDTRLPGGEPTLPEVLQHDLRYESICRELSSLEAHIIGLNEVTTTMLEKLLREEWVRKRYRVSVVPHDSRCKDLAAVRGFGNVLLSRLEVVSVEHMESPAVLEKTLREFPVMTFCIAGRDGQARRIAVASAHLIAFPYLNERRRATQLQALTSELARSERGLDGCVVMGDFNFHRDAEEASIPAGWSEVPAVVAAGPTWDIARNTMIPHYLPFRNIYNGFGIGYGRAWAARMRLDRVLVQGAAFDLDAANSKLFADRPIAASGDGPSAAADRCKDNAEAQMQAPLPSCEAHRQLPWEAYLFPSDHFGLVLELPLKCL